MNIQTAVRAEKAELQRLAREEAYATPLKDFHPGAPRLFQDDILWPFFERLRKEEPVHYCTNAPIEPYWSVTKYNDIMHVDTNHGIFSSDSTLGGISIRKLPRWSDVSTALPKSGIVESPEQRRKEMDECYAYFANLWNERVNAEPRNDLLSMMAHSEATRHMDPDNLMGNIILLVVGGNDTTRNTMSGSVLALNEHPEQYQKLRDNPALIDSMVPEVIRWQTPLAHMRRTALVDTELGGKKIREGDRVVMWYVSGNRDEEAIENPNDFIIDRARPRTHLSFGFGIHRCVGMRLAELQLKIVWQEMLKRFDNIEVVGEPKRVYSSFVRGIEQLPVRIPA